MRSIANKILRQLGNGLVAMTGATQFIDLNDGVKFRFKGSTKANLVIIRLDTRDTYEVEFWMAKGLVHKKVATVEAVCADQLRHVFEHMTGLRLSPF